ncbi:extensin family protein [Sorangium sp. So ce321]|uniref:extensin family protein n=1 Tax=Sorangium sp. So ce321 TaxID=3133300 RepID=UPI003F633921
MAFSRLRCLLKPLACALLASVATLGPAPATAASPFLMTPEASIAEASPAYRYANMTDDEALAELDRRKILYLKVERAPGVRAPIRLTGRLNGVNFHSVLPPEQRVTSVFEILDARLALALDDFAAVLARHDIDEVVHYTMYRPNVPMPGREGADDEGEHGHAIAQAAGADSAVRKESTKPATSVSLGEKGELDGTSKAPEEPPRRLKEKGAAEAVPKEKGAAEAVPQAKGAAEAVPQAKGAAEAVPKEKGAAEAVPKEKGAAEAVPKEKGAAEAVPKEKGAAEAVPKEKGAAEAVPKEKGAAEAEPQAKGAAEAVPKAKGVTEAVPKAKGAAEAVPKEKAAAPVTPGPRARATAARSGPVKTAGKAGARRAARRKAGPTGATASPVKRSGAVALRTDAGQKPRGAVALRTDAGQKPRGDVALRTDAAQKPRGTWAPPGTRHPAGLAIDVGALKKRDGTWISVARHFHGRIGDKTCGEGAPQPELPEARELRSIVCEAADLGIFTYVLTPNFNAAHVDHYHMEIKPGVRWFLYH